MNSDWVWGTLGPESFAGHRRLRTLGLGPAVRACNEAAVPGVGRLWYYKQLAIATLVLALVLHGIVISEHELHGATPEQMALAREVNDWAPKLSPR